MKKVMELNHQDIVAYYQHTKSAKDTARRFQLSDQKVRKILIAEGAFETPRSKEINELYELGFTIREISDYTGLTTGCVSSYLPYIKCEYYVPNASKGALYLRQWKAKKRQTSDYGLKNGGVLSRMTAAGMPLATD